MPRFSHSLGQRRYVFDGLTSLLAKASPPKSGDRLAGIAAASDEERVAARLALAEVPLKTFLEEPLVPYEEDEVTRLILTSLSGREHSLSTAPQSRPTSIRPFFPSSTFSEYGESPLPANSGHPGSGSTAAVRGLQQPIRSPGRVRSRLMGIERIC